MRDLPPIGSRVRTTAGVKYGSLFSGAGGLDFAVEQWTGATAAWVCEQDPQASIALAAHGTAPNLGDITAVDWSEVEPVDVICGGFPCQDISNAGRRAGITGARSGLWSFYADAVRHLRPRLVLIENVGALLVRGLDTVLCDLAEVGYDATWGCVRASDAGAPHRRERVFIVATDTTNQRREWEWVARGRRDGPTDSSVAAGGPLKLLPTPTVQQGRNATSGRTNPDSEHHDGWTLNDVAYADRWGDYAPAIERWEHVLGRPAPEPVDGKGRLSPRFVEWMMGWSDGWVTHLDHLGVKRTAQLRLLRNGVVPQQALLAFVALETLAVDAPGGVPVMSEAER